MVRDNLTGLIWTRNANLSGSKKSWANAVIYCNELVYGGQDDWRLPTVNELQSLIHAGYSAPALPNTQGTGKWTNGAPFTNVQSAYYWSSTTYASIPDRAFDADLSSGRDYREFKTVANYVWPVRAGQ
jgi:hypothetical protein